MAIVKQQKAKKKLFVIGIDNLKEHVGGIEKIITAF